MLSAMTDMAETLGVTLGHSPCLPELELLSLTLPLGVVLGLFLS